MPTIPADEIREKVAAIYRAVGASVREAEVVASLLVESNLLGHDSHGVIRVAQYVSAINSGRIKAGVETVVEKETAATAVVNGNLVEALNLGDRVGDIVELRVSDITAAVPKAKLNR